MTTKTIIMDEDYIHAGQKLYAGNKYPLEVNVADLLLECGVAHEEGKDTAERSTKPIKLQPSKVVTKTKTK